MQNKSKAYSPTEIERDIYNYWLENNYFHSVPNDKKPYIIVIPPPNVTGVLHMGHMLNNTLQDILIRRARMMGYNACWVPGTDHASIATEAKVVNKLKEEGKSKEEIGKEKFLEAAWEWTNEHGGKILDQLQYLGCSCDWERTQFTLDEKLSKSVTKVFIELYNKGLIYRDYKMVNWDPEAKTNISDEEVNYIEKNGKLYYLKYKIVGSDNYLVVATTRPETIFGDNAVCVNPNDERYKDLKGKSVIVPIVGREVPIIEDDYVDPEFGTGCLKITPANDINDYEIGKRHQIAPIEIFNEDATLNENAASYNGKDRFTARKEIAQELNEKGLMEKEEDYVNNVGTSERTGAVIEPRLMIQWFLKMETIAPPALEVVEKDEVKFFPRKYKNTYRHWLENIRDWNISRQLWWGHEIPAYYYNEENDFVVAESKEKALELARVKSGNLELELSDLRQEKDVLDTWFSSWLWPISVFDGILEPENNEIEYYYPTHDLVTGPDIIFFWVARMIMAGLEFRNEIPFENVYFTGIVRDNQRRKMSKQLGNSPDPIGLIEKYGADGVRVGMMMSSSAGNDLLFDEDLCLQGRNFANKIWNGYKLVQSWEIDDKPQSNYDIEAIEWYENRFYQCLENVNKHFESFRISDALMEIYKLVWDDYSSWFLEMIKPNYGDKMSRKTYDKTISILENNLKLLHPFMPFISELIWQEIKKRTPEEALIVTPMPKVENYDKQLLSDFDWVQQMVTAIRNFRVEQNISPKEKLELFVDTNESLPFQNSLTKMAKLSNVFLGITDMPAQTIIVQNIEAKIPFSEDINVEEEIGKIREELKYTEGFLHSVNKKLSNEKFVNNAPEQVVATEQKKKADAEEKIALLNKKLEELEKM